MPRFIELPTHYDLPEVYADESYDDDGLDFFRDLGFALLFEAIGAVIVLSLWWFAWAALP